MTPLSKTTARSDQGLSFLDWCVDKISVSFSPSKPAKSLSVVLARRGVMAEERLVHHIIGPDDTKAAAQLEAGSLARGEGGQLAAGRQVEEAHQPSKRSHRKSGIRSQKKIAVLRGRSRPGSCCPPGHVADFSRLLAS
jgi:hypothetical protein